MSNALAKQASLYLRQHADNPVNWLPWSDRALADAQRKDKPILLSIGYSACHWCHVMAHESFEDPETAALMNELYVNIKVDREERPDLDKVYQLAHQLMNQRGGGWPLTVFLDPKTLAPFYCGTYFPPLARQGMPAFSQVLRQLASAFTAQRSEIASQQGHLQKAYAQLVPEAGSLPDTGLIERSVRELGERFDQAHGGWSGAPKFPHPQICELMQTLGGGAGRQQALFTLEQMCRRGLFDQIGGGFFRYCVDAEWQIPHFEKMLYDNALLLSALSRAYADTGSRGFEIPIEATIGWLTRDMRDESGLYYATLDADSEGEEGLFYVWEGAEIQALAGPSWPLVESVYGLSGSPNFDGRWHLQLVGSDPGAAQLEKLEAVKLRLLASRNERSSPGRDDKLLTAWNALLAQGLIDAGLACDRAEWVDMAAGILSALRRSHWKAPKLLSLSQDGKPGTPGFLDDYAFSLQAALRLLEARWDTELLDWAIAVADAMLDRFGGSTSGALYFCLEDPQLIHRPIPLMDDALPAGNAVAVRALLTLGELLSEPHYLEAAEKILQAAARPLEQMPAAHVGMLLALQAWHQGTVIVMRGAARDAPAWREAIRDRARLLCIPASCEGLPDALASKTAGPTGVATAYLCRRGSCSPPITSIPDLRRALTALG